MAIKGLTEKIQFPRLGKIKRGVKKANLQGVKYPHAVDYFVLDEKVPASLKGAFHNVYGDKPTELNIMFPVSNTEIITPQYFKCWSASRGKICQGNGETAQMLIDTETGALVNRDTREFVKKEVICDGRACPHYQAKQCREIMHLQFMLPDIPGVGIWQLDTSSVLTIKNINSCIALYSSIIGHIHMIPLKLIFQEAEVSPDGKKKKIKVLTLHVAEKLVDLVRLARKPIDALFPTPDESEMPLVDEEYDEMIAPDAQAPEKPRRVRKSRALVATAPASPPQVNQVTTSTLQAADATTEISADTILSSEKETTEKLTKAQLIALKISDQGELFTNAYKHFKLNRTQALAQLGYANDGVVRDPQYAWHQLVELNCY